MSQNDGTLAVLLTVHAGADPTHFQCALSSIYGQIRLPDEVIVVEDGPLDAAHWNVLDRFAASTPVLQRVPLVENCGTYVAMQVGLEIAASQWVAVMDSDDIALPARFERQMELLGSGNYDVIGSAVAEFDGDPANIIGIRRLPEMHEEIRAYSSWNNPINHPACVYRRALALEVGGYRNLYGLGDYDLFARMLAAGARMYNLAEPLVLFRGGRSMLRRRKAWRIVTAEVTLQRTLKSCGLVGRAGMIRNIAVRSVFRLLPVRVMSYAYREMFFRNPSGRASGQMELGV